MQVPSTFAQLRHELEGRDQRSPNVKLIRGEGTRSGE
jgi:hypothetical protein